MDPPHCYNCQSDLKSYYAEENGFDLVKCSNCGLLYVASRPDADEITHAHTQGLHRGEKVIDVTGKFDAHSIPKYQSILEDIYSGDIGHIGSWLDVGCGHGEFLVALKEYSSDRIVLRGTEPNIHKQESAKQNGVVVDFFDIDTHQQKYDVVSILNVYSHLPDPPAFLDSLKNLLKPGGELIIETGDTANLSAEDHYRPFYLPDHLSFASEGIVCGILEQLGFDIISVSKYPYPDRGKRPTWKTAVKETIKLFLPQYTSKIWHWKKHVARWEAYSQTDMYIRAKLPSEHDANLSNRTSH